MLPKFPGGPKNNVGTARPRNEAKSPRVQGKVYALNQNNVADEANVIEGTLLIF